MPIATIHRDLSPSGALPEADLARSQGPEPGQATSSFVPALHAKATALAAKPQSWASRGPEPFYKPMPTASTFALRADAFEPAARGYALSAASPGSRTPSPVAAASTAAKAKTGSAQKSPTGKSSSAKSTAKKASTSRELAFLDEKHLSIEDKLFQFMVLMTRKNDQELVAAMKEYDTKKAAQGSSSSSSSSTAPKASISSEDGSSSSGTKQSVLSPDGGGLFGFLGDALGGIGKALVGSAETLVKDLGGPALAGVATAFGMPFLAPAALQLGGDLGAGLIESVASTVGLGASSGTRTGSSRAKSGSSTSSAASKASSSSAKTTSAAAEPEEFDEKLEMFKLQRLVEKQNAMFSALTNAMKSMHDTQMTAVQNIR